jgi:hypothetical protein
MSVNAPFDPTLRVLVRQVFSRSRTAAALTQASEGAAWRLKKAKWQIRLEPVYEPQQQVKQSGYFENTL